MEDVVFHILGIKETYLVTLIAVFMVVIQQVNEKLLEDVVS